jgi:hypothetical protein
MSIYFRFPAYLLRDSLDEFVEVYREYMEFSNDEDSTQRIYQIIGRRPGQMHPYEHGVDYRRADLDGTCVRQFHIYFDVDEDWTLFENLSTRFRRNEWPYDVEYPSDHENAPRIGFYRPGFDIERGSWATDAHRPTVVIDDLRKIIDDADETASDTAILDQIIVHLNDYDHRNINDLSNYYTETLDLLDVPHLFPQDTLPFNQIR